MSYNVGQVVADYVGRQLMRYGCLLLVVGALIGAVIGYFAS